jgi:hypothetical protein
MLLPNIKLEKLAFDKHCSLLWTFVNYDLKKFYKNGTIFSFCFHRGITRYRESFMKGKALYN